MTAEQELAYLEGERAAWRAMLGECIRRLGGTNEDPLNRVARLEAERADVIAVLRRVCGEHGDNDWPDNMHPGDVVEKHLERYLEER